ncbi:MAG: folate-binding protein [Pseudomonadota bacterium]
MNPDWRTFLAAAGGVPDEHGILHFGNPAEERRAAADGQVRVDLSHLSLLRVGGADAVTFLQGQLSNDVRQLTAEQGQLSSYCTPKGRMLAVVRLMRDGDDMLLQLPAELAASIQQRLKMFILRSKVTVEPAADRVAVGLSGPATTDIVSSHFGSAPATAHACLRRQGVIVMALPGIHPRYQIIGPVEAITAVWHNLSANTRPCGYPVWRWLDIAAGVPSVWSSTSEAFVPQTTNLELLGGVNFKKGCYPGQEIVARMQYLGKLKQRMVHGHVDGDRAPLPGDPVFTPSYGDQPAGTVVDAQPSPIGSRRGPRARDGASAASPPGGFDLLVVAPIESASSHEVRLLTPDGPVLTLSAPPYPLVTGAPIDGH